MTVNRTPIEKLTGRPYNPRPNPYRAADIRDDRAFNDELLLTPLDETELERVARWQFATELERGQALYELMKLVGAMPHLPPKTDVFPGFRNRGLAKR